MDLINIAAAMCTSDHEGSLTPVFQFIGNIVSFIKIAVPIILVVMGSIDLTKAVMASKDDEIKKAQSTLLKRAIVGVIIFFIPAIVNLLVGMVFPDYRDDENYNCVRCVLDTSECP